MKQLTKFQKLAKYCNQIWIGLTRLLERYRITPVIIKVVFLLILVFKLLSTIYSYLPVTIDHCKNR